MRVITQEGVPIATRMTLPSEPRSREPSHDLFFDIEDFTGSPSYGSSNSNALSHNDDIIVIAEADVPRRPTQQTINKAHSNDRDWNDRSEKGQKSFSSEDNAQKKFGSAKAISSDQYFRNSNSDGDAVSNYSPSPPPSFH